MGVMEEEKETETDSSQGQTEVSCLAQNLCGTGFRGDVCGLCQGRNMKENEKGLAKCESLETWTLCISYFPCC